MKRYLILLFTIGLFSAGCGSIPTYPVPATLDIGQVIAETSAVEMTRIAVENLPQATEVVAAEEVVVATLTPNPEPTQELSTEELEPGKDIALLLGTLSMEEGSWVFTGEQFHVTWRIRNIGETTWNDAYSLVYGGGEAFGQDLSVPLAVEVVPGDIVDLTLVLIAPERTGLYRGEWWLVSPEGTPFGVGYEDPQPLAVDVIVENNPVELGDHQRLQFFDNYSTAEWRDQYGSTFCNAEGNIGVHGSVKRLNDVVFEGVIEENEPTLVMMPAQGEGGFIEGIFPPFHITSGNYFYTHVGCLYENHFCDVTFKIFIQVVGEKEVDLYWESSKQFDGEWIKVHAPLEKYRGKDIIFIFRVENNGDSTGDVVGWFAPVILH